MLGLGSRWQFFTQIMLPNHLRSAARDACISIVDHYSDPIHYAVSSNSNSLGDCDSSDDVSAARQNHGPYFDAVLGRPMPDLPPVGGFWYRRLLETSDVSSNESKNDMTTARLGAARELLACYESAIHPCMSRSRQQFDGEDHHDNYNGEPLESKLPLNAMVEVMMNYELLLAHLMRVGSGVQSSADWGRNAVNDELINNPNPTHNPLEKVDGEELSKRVEGDHETSAADEASPAPDSDVVIRIVATIADDVLRWSVKLPKKDGSALWKVRNVLLPCLLRLIEHLVVLLSSYERQNIGKRSAFNKMGRHCLAIATLTALPFVGDGKLNSGVFGCGRLLDWILDRSNEGSIESPELHDLSIAHTLQECSLPPVLSESIMKCDFMQRSVVDWSVPSAHFGAPWTDGVAGIGSRAAVQLLRSIYQCSHCVALSPYTEEVDVNCWPENRSRYLRLLLCKISQNVGVHVVVSTLRAHFFGRPMYTGILGANAMIVQPNARGVFMPMVQRGSGSSENHKRAAVVYAKSDEKPHIEIPMRISAAAILLCAVNFEESDEAISDIIPVALSLLNDVQSIHQAIGALVFISVIEAASSSKLAAIPSFVETSTSALTSSFEVAVRMVIREEPTVLTLVCLAQSRWIRFLGSCSCYQGRAAVSASAVHTMARKSAGDLLIAIGKQVQSGGRGGNDERIAGAFVAGINPLLAQLAAFPEAASVEIARAGLAVILPLVGWSGISLEVRSAQVLALAGLISLMNGSHPIMPHHGKKIMTEVFLLLDRTDKDAAYLHDNKATDLIKGNKINDDEFSTDATSKMALHSASVALAICGDSAEVILDHIISSQSPKKRLIDRCLEIRASAKLLTGNVK